MWAVEGTSLNTIVTFTKAIDKSSYVNSLFQLGYVFTYKSSVLTNAIEIQTDIETIKKFLLTH